MKTRDDGGMMSAALASVRRIRSVLCGGLGLLASSALAYTSALPTGPEVGDQTLSPFYQWQAALPDQPGRMLRAEPMMGQPEMMAAAVLQRILYTSEDIRWHAGIVPVSGTLYLPKGKIPQGGWPVVAWAHGTLGVADSCAPSWTGHSARDAHYINQWLQQGFAVVATDYQGLGGPGPHPYLMWEAEGRSVLDSIRAVLQHASGRLANTVIITGQSQGSGAALGASRIAPHYTPELHLRATMATGVVSTFPEGPVELNGGAFGRHVSARFNMLRLLGGSLPDDGLTANAVVTEQGHRLLALARTTCASALREEERRQNITQDSAFVGGNKQLVAALLPVNTMTMTRFPTPLFIGTGLADRTVAPHHQYAAVAALCAAGNPVWWKTYPGNTHNGTVNTAFADELRFVRTVLKGASQPNSCETLRDPGKAGTARAGIAYND